MVLRSSPKTRGHWGEVALRRVLELAGLTEHCDFHAEKTLANEDGCLWPDVVISLPGGRTLVVDAKAPLAGYLDAVDAVDEAERDRCLQRHAEHLKKHVQQLGSKAYYARLPQEPDYVVMFVSGENFYAAAAERDPDLFEFAASQGVIVATPATLIALAKSGAFGLAAGETRGACAKSA
jgi:DNA recombination protein RmuC